MHNSAVFPHSKFVCFARFQQSIFILSPKVITWLVVVEEMDFVLSGRNSLYTSLRIISADRWKLKSCNTFLSSISGFLCQYHSINSLYLSSSKYCSYQKDKRTKSANLQTKERSTWYRTALNREVLSQCLFVQPLTGSNHCSIPCRRNRSSSSPKRPDRLWCPDNNLINGNRK